MHCNSDESEQTNFEEEADCAERDKTQRMNCVFFFKNGVNIPSEIREQEVKEKP